MNNTMTEFDGSKAYDVVYSFYNNDMVRLEQGANTSMGFNSSLNVKNNSITVTTINASFKAKMCYAAIGQRRL